ncbi:MAG: hypothetical protein PHW53_05160 [Patescibacteria group bacterium]|nr:hypothetical protein [Patescibacteria group bacterium]
MKKKLSEENFKILIESARAGLTLEQISYRLMIPQRTLQRWITDPDIVAQYKKARHDSMNDIAARMERVAKGQEPLATPQSITAAIFYLKTQAQWRETVDINSTVTLEVNKFKQDILSAITKAIKDPALVQKIADEIEKTSTDKSSE